MKKKLAQIAPLAYPIRQAAELLNVSIWTLRRWAYRGEIASLKLGKRLMVRAEEIERLLNEGERPRLESR